eukprot:TRINITY_DN67604_c0_g1_i1.p1 TRINITY_DN67604_c0_g1~~TRINITY_DN67604_c0_g1_i1.p1  ORF type:complete len:597 (-),score=64.70 TRINITY_DN67604_c0_g1_i1:40-1722(-)
MALCTELLFAGCLRSVHRNLVIKAVNDHYFLRGALPIERLLFRSAVEAPSIGLRRYFTSARRKLASEAVISVYPVKRTAEMHKLWRRVHPKSMRSLALADSVVQSRLFPSPIVLSAPLHSQPPRRFARKSLQRRRMRSFADEWSRIRRAPRLAPGQCMLPTILLQDTLHHDFNGHTSPTSEVIMANAIAVQQAATSAGYSNGPVLVTYLGGGSYLRWLHAWHGKAETLGLHQTLVLASDDEARRACEIAGVPHHELWLPLPPPKSLRDSVRGATSTKIGGGDSAKLDNDEFATATERQPGNGMGRLIGLAKLVAASALTACGLIVISLDFDVLLFRNPLLAAGPLAGADLLLSSNEPLEPPLYNFGLFIARGFASAAFFAYAALDYGRWLLEGVECLWDQRYLNAALGLSPPYDKFSATPAQKDMLYRQPKTLEWQETHYTLRDGCGSNCGNRRPSVVPSPGTAEDTNNWTAADGHARRLAIIGRLLRLRLLPSQRFEVYTQTGWPANDPRELATAHLTCMYNGGAPGSRGRLDFFDAFFTGWAPPELFVGGRDAGIGFC